MTFKKLQEEMGWALNECKSKDEELQLLKSEVRAHFDFPIHGNAVNYKIIQFDKVRGLTLYNAGIDRPQGHK